MRHSLHSGFGINHLHVLSSLLIFTGFDIPKAVSSTCWIFQRPTTEGGGPALETWLPNKVEILDPVPFLSCGSVFVIPQHPAQPHLAHNLALVPRRVVPGKPPSNLLPKSPWCDLCRIAPFVVC